MRSGSTLVDGLDVVVATAFERDPASDRGASGNGTAPDPGGVPVLRPRSFAPDQSGQTTAEYALVLLVAAVIVGVFATFANSGALTQMFDQIVSSLVERAAGS